MAEYWKNVLPVDPYLVKCRSLIQDIDRQIVTLLYQPLIGSFAFSLYMTLWGELEQNRMWGSVSTHRQLMGMMQSNLSTIHQEQGKLEGIGLLKTYLQETDNERLFIYELIPPLRPNDFFQDGMLNVFLYNRVGKTKFQQLKQHFSHSSIPDQAHDVTRAFNEVFDSLQPSEWKVSEDIVESTILPDNEEYLKVGQAGQLNITEEVFDFDLFFAGLSETLIPRKAITTQIKDTIKKLSFLYNIDPLQMQNIVMDAMSEDEVFTTEALRKSASDWYQLERNGFLPKLVDKIQPENLREDKRDEDEQDSLDSVLISQLESISPRKLLQDIADGVEPSKADLKIVEEVMFNQKLEPGVTNVLIYYVMLKTDMKLSKNYIEKIASHWARKKVKTVREAMKLAKDEHRQYLNWAEGKNNQSSSRSKVIREEKIPDWFKETDQVPSEKMKPQQENLNKDELEMQKEKMIEELKKLKKHN